ncbi:MAG: Tab2/Atab2 family RNA-binding protein [Xenococcaceae cyanobacterium]
MKIWQADFYKRPLKDEQGQTLWELLICESSHSFIYDAKCPQSQANNHWLVSQLQEAAKGQLPDLIQVFRPQSLGLLAAAGEKLGIKVEATRRTAALKEELQKRASQYTSIGEGYNPVKLEKPPPQTLPENIWGEVWRFATLPAGEILDSFGDRPIPILDMPKFLFPINLGIPSTVAVPGVVIYGGRKSMQLARWLQEAKPVALNYIPTEVSESGGLVLEAGLVDRWIVATFEDTEVAKAAQAYEQRKLASQGLHFLLVQPDDSGMTYSGFWLLDKA